MIHINDVLGTGVSPDRAHVRTVLAGVFNRDIRDDIVETLSPTEAVVILAAKMLLDMDYKSGHVQAIFRFLGPWVDKLVLADEMAILSVVDNCYATLVSNHFTPVYDFVHGKKVDNAAAPILQMSINLSKLLEVVRAKVLERESRSPAEDA